LKFLISHFSLKTKNHPTPQVNLAMTNEKWKMPNGKSADYTPTPYSLPPRVPLPTHC
jgi:hypothetical protein